MDSMGTDDRPHVSIDEALANGWFELWYQPKIDLKQKFLAGAEALARIRHPVHGDLAPGTFIPIVDGNSIERLTEFALVAALENWPLFEQTGFDLHLSINVPVRMLSLLPVAEIVGAHRPRSERWPGIILEVSEEQIARDPAFVEQMAEEWRSHGITIAIDDVGGADTSSASLNASAFGEFKLDRRFVKDSAVDTADAGVCQAVIDLAHHLGGAAVASGVETQTDLRALMAMGCDFAQGSVIAPLMPQEQFLDMLLQRVNRQGAQARTPDHSASGPAAAIGRVA